MSVDCLREISLTDAVLRPPLTGKEAEKEFVTFDGLDRHTSLPGVFLFYLFL